MASYVSWFFVYVSALALALLFFAGAGRRRGRREHETGARWERFPTPPR